MARSTGEVERRKRVARAIANPIYFAEFYVRPFDPNWTTTLPRFAQEMLAFAVSNKFGVVMLPPEYMKTTLLSQVLPLWLTLDATVHQKQLRGLLLSEEERMAGGNLSVVAWHILNNERILADFVDQRGEPILVPDDSENVWREDAIIVKRRGASKDPTWQAKGLDSKGIQGRRLDWVIGDDMITLRNSTSPTLRKRALDIMDLVVETRLVRNGKCVIAGNFNDPKDLLHDLSRRKGWGTFKRPSMWIGSPDTPPKDSQLQEADLLWPENWDRERLLEIWERTPNRFRRVHLMDPRAEHGERLNTGWVQLVEPDDTPFSIARGYMALDPAPGGDGDDLDFFNISVGLLHNMALDLVESFDVRAPAGRQAQLVGLLHDRWNRIGMGVQAIGVSKVALDRYFQGVLEVVREDLKPKIVPISVPGDKETRLEALGAYPQSGWLRVSSAVWERQTSAPDDRPQELTLMEQWRDFPYAAHDDKLDGLDLLVRTAREFSVLGDVEWDLEVLEA
jgi:hypothetical protein